MIKSEAAEGFVAAGIFDQKCFSELGIRTDCKIVMKPRDYLLSGGSFNFCNGQ